MAMKKHVPFLPSFRCSFSVVGLARCLSCEQLSCKQTKLYYMYRVAHNTSSRSLLACLLAVVMRAVSVARTC